MFLSLICCGMFYRRPVAPCFVSLAVSFIMSFHIDSSNDKVQSDKVIRSNHVLQYVIDLKY